jgi:hypothetical protein
VGVEVGDTGDTSQAGVIRVIRLVNTISHTLLSIARNTPLKFSGISTMVKILFVNSAYMKK